VAELTTLESKLAEVTGLAMAARDSGLKVQKLVEQEDADGLVKTLERMAKEAAETEERCTELAGTFEGKKTALLEKARETKREAEEMARTYLGDDADALDGFEFLTMAEAGEVGHWEILAHLNKRAHHAGVRELTSWGIPIQQRHLTEVRASSLQLADEEDPDETG